MKYSHPADRQDKSKIFPQNIQRRFNSAWISFITLWGRNGYSNTLFVTFPALSIILYVGYPCTSIFLTIICCCKGGKIMHDIFSRKIEFLDNIFPCLFR